jgi:hypothetical protein
MTYTGDLDNVMHLIRCDELRAAKRSLARKLLHGVSFDE